MPSDQSKPLFGGLESRAEALRCMSPELLADVYLYSAADGVKRLTVPGWGCPLLVLES
jgi:hypothetical protein